MALNWKPAVVLIVGVVAIGAWKMSDAAEFDFVADMEESSGERGGGEGWAARWSGEPFDRITLAGPDDLTFVTDGAHAVRATGDAKALEALQYKVRNGELRIRRKSSGWSFGDSGEATIAVSAPALRALVLAGSGSAKIDRMDGDDVELTVAGSGDAAVASITAKKLEGSIAGSGSLRLVGTAETADISIAGSGSVLGERFRSDTVDISIAGSGDVTMASEGSVEASLMGSGDVTIKGNAKCKSSAMGSGSLTCG
ncbi:head GIN domain-containing protein [Blastomonas sp.]|uniref:head GIN domain-containing protein n=1 Tax=Blastomonas sp. TaxID=1909299 RepID=UPI002630A8B3|nr:head GIN domain-containing protein [Blastomonas sp.]MDM7955914.1 head GIN domain-containing protein [Blastomonas sp.]